MKSSIITFLLLSINLSAFGQQKDTWIAIWNQDSSLIGFKDSKGNIKIEPKFTPSLTWAEKFDDIIAVREERGEGKERHYYHLTKNGKKVGRDSMYISDNSFDCESEGFIRFRVKRTDKMGLFDRNGKIVIPAKYDYISRVMNGMVLTLKGAKTKSVGEHSILIGGKQSLIDTNNQILITDIKFKGLLDFFSLKVSSKPNNDTTRQNFIGTNKKYYSFIDFDKEFRFWLNTALLKNFTKNNLLTHTHKEVNWQDTIDGGLDDKINFIERNFELLKAKLLELKSANCRYNIFDERLNRYEFDTEEYKEYFNNCGESKDWQYPVKNIVTTYKVGKEHLQDHFSFLRTAKGYKLISVTIGNGKLRNKD